MAFDELNEEFAQTMKSEKEFELDDAKSIGEEKEIEEERVEIDKLEREYAFPDESKPLEMSGLMSSIGNERGSNEWI